MSEKRAPNPLDRLINFVDAIIDRPITFVREKIVVPNRKTYYWYHQKLPRVPTIDECYTDDLVCFTEANLQFFRDKKVDAAIVSILRQRYLKCLIHEARDEEKCLPLFDTYEGTWLQIGSASAEYHLYYNMDVSEDETMFSDVEIMRALGFKERKILKYNDELRQDNTNIQDADGDIGSYGDVKTAYFKQKHRMVWERRHGPVGSGMKEDIV